MINMGNELVYKIPKHEIEVTLFKIDGKRSGTITSNLKNDTNCEDDAEYIAAMDAIESMILSMACQGYNVEHDMFVSAIDDAIKSCVENL